MFEDEHSHTATEAEAHVEWHINSGVPMGTPGCPQDACHGPDEYDEYDIEHANDDDPPQRSAAGEADHVIAESARLRDEAPDPRDRDEVYHGLGEIDGGDGDDLPF